jgi:chitin disaccharide deacetylase
MESSGGDAEGLLIVNADDAGLDRETTDAILDCLRAGTVTSTTAMAWMVDSRRAAEELSGAELAVGLHLNVIEPYTAHDAPASARERQGRVAAYFGRFPRSRWLYNPAIRADVDACVADQLECFRQLYGSEPTHVDGHQHGHLYPNVLFSRALRSVEKIRPAFTFAPGEKSIGKRLFRAAVNRLVQHRFAAPERFRSIQTLVPELGGSAAARLRDARHLSMEVMCHPGWPNECRYLASEQWRACLEDHRLGSYSHLRRRPARTPPG